MVAMRLDPEKVNIVDPATIRAALIGIANIGFPAIGVDPIECTNVSGAAKHAVEAVGAVERVGQITRRAYTSGAGVIEIADALDSESGHIEILRNVRRALRITSHAK